jgi:hypothetical protein
MGSMVRVAIGERKGFGKRQRGIGRAAPQARGWSRNRPNVAAPAERVLATLLKVP